MMKTETRELLDYCTGILVDLGAKKQRRGLGVFSGAQSGLIPSVSIQAREWPDGVVHISTYSQCTWVELEKKVCLGFGQKYKFGESFTRTELTNAGDMFEFFAGVDDNAVFGAFKSHLISVAIPRAIEFCDDQALHNFLAEQVTQSSGYPEKVVASKLLINGSEAGSQQYLKFQESGSLTEFSKQRLKDFWQKIVS